MSYIGQLRKGSLITGNGVDNAELPIGTDTFVLTADATQPLGVKWASIASATNHAVQVGNSSGGLTSIPVATNGQVLLGSTGADPVFANLNSADGSITYTTGAGSLGLNLTRKMTTYGYTNVGMSYSAGTFTVNSENGSAFSSSNPGYISLPSLVTPGRVIRYTITANQTFVDHNGGVPTIDGNLFGFLTGDVQSTDVPFFLYAVSNSAAVSPETSVTFMISRQAGRQISPLATDIGKTGSSIATNEWCFFSLGNVTVADYASSPCQMIGSFRMTKVSASNGWIVTALASRDGIGTFQQGQLFQLSTGVMGAKAGSYWMNNGGTAPTFNAQSYQYMINPDGTINACTTGLTPTVVGAGAVNATVITPMRNRNIPNFPIQTGGRMVTTVRNTLLPTVDYTNHYATIIYVNASTDGQLLNSDIGAGLNDISVNLYYYPRIS